MTIQNVKEAIHNLENLNPTDNCAYEKALLIFLSIKQIPYLIYEFIEPLNLFRTRTHDKDDFFKEYKDIVAPPTHLVKTFARCNRPFQPLFYCSENRPTSYMELVEYWAENKIKDDYLYVTLSKWTLLKPLLTLIVSSPHAQDRTSDYDKFHGNQLDIFINQYQDEFKEAMMLFYKFLFDRFRKRAKHDLRTYIITSAYCNLAFVKASGQVDAIFYPSVPFGGQGVNFALAPHFDVNTCLKLEEVIRNKFLIRDVKPEPIFTETELIKCKSIDSIARTIEW